MNAPPGIEPVPPEPSPADKAPTNWREAMVLLARTRIEIFRIELGDVMRSGLRKAILLGIAIFALVATWVLALAGGIGAIAAANGWEWHWVALAAAGLHLLVAGGCVFFATRKGQEAFPVTRSEFQRDTECIDRKNSRGFKA